MNISIATDIDYSKYDDITWIPHKDSLADKHMDTLKRTPTINIIREVETVNSPKPLMD